MSKIKTMFYNHIIDRPKQKVTLSKVYMQDLSPCSFIYAQGFKKSLEDALDIITNLITSPKLQVIVALDDNEKVIGMCALEINDSKTSVLLSNFAIHPDYQKLGFGKTILMQLIWQIQNFYPEITFTLKVRAENYIAISLYRKIGFVETATV